MSGLHSFNAMEEAIKDGDFDKFFANINLSSADTIPYALMRINVNDLREIAADIVQEARYNNRDSVYGISGKIIKFTI